MDGLQIAVLCRQGFVNPERPAMNRMRQILSGLTISLSMLSAAQAQVLESPNAISKIRIEGVDEPADKKLLLNATTQYLTFLAGPFSLPKEIFMANGPGGPEYKDSMVTLRYPYYDGDETKTAAESIAINLHEVSHFIFELTLRRVEAKSPEVLWAFLTRLDDIGAADSLDLISKTKSQTKYKNLSDEKIQQIFSAYQQYGSIYNELMADTMVAFFLQDPQAPFKDLYFEKLANSPDPTERQAQANHQLRRFDLPHDMGAARHGLVQFRDPYAVLSPSRQALWQAMANYQTQHARVPRSQILLRAFTTVVDSFIQTMQNFSVDLSTVTADQMNADLVDRLKSF
jgi:hypothetical protein